MYVNYQIRKKTLKKNGVIVGKQINYGTFSKVHRGILSETRELVAIKVIKLKAKDQNEKSYLRHNLPREIEIIQKLNHTNTGTYVY